MREFTAGAFLSDVQIDKGLFGLSSPEELFEAVRRDALPCLPLPGKTEDLSWCYRGQRDASWGMTSSLWRTMPPSDQGSGQRWEPGLMRAEQRVLQEMRKQGLGRHMSDGELLMVLQHHGVPTRLIDVSDRALEALFFAVERDDALPGRLFILGLLPDLSTEADLAGAADEPLPWAGYGRGAKQAVAEWTNQIWVVKDASLDPRMRAQRGKFLVGGLPRAYGGVGGMSFDDDSVTIPNVQRTCNLSVAFPRKSTRKRVTSRAAVCWNVEIPGAWKPALRVLLKTQGITQDSMYPPFAESRRLGEYVAGQRWE